MKNYYLRVLNKSIFLLALTTMLGLSFHSRAISSNETFRVERGERPPISLHNIPSDAYEQGALLIRFKPEYADHLEQNPVVQTDNGAIRFNLPSVDYLNNIFGAKNVKQVFLSEAFNNTYTARHKAWGFNLWYKLSFDYASDIKNLAEHYNSLDEIEIAEPEFKKVLFKDSEFIHLEQTGELLENRSNPWIPDDPQFNQQWHYHNTGQTGGTPGADISLPQAWEIEKGNNNVIVAILDDGIQFTHPDLAGNMWENIGFNFVSGNSTVVPGNHGTHVAGTVAAVNNNGVGVAGVAGGSGSGDGVRLMSCQIFQGGSMGGFHLAIVWAADNGAAIAQNSWGYGSPGTYNQIDLDAIDYFNINGGGNAILNGGLTVFSAGNSNFNLPRYPGYYSGTYAVAATNHNDAKAWYSNFGYWVDISSPGGETNTVSSQGVLSTLINNSYAFYQGTSMAAPHVSGVAALVVSHVYGQFEAEDVKDILSSSADDHYAMNPNYIGEMGSGRLNAYHALIEAQGYYIGVMNPSNFTATTVGSTDIELTWNKNTDNNDVMLASSLSNTFGLPDSGMVYQPGATLPGGGTVLYTGGNTEFLHIDLEGITRYYYRIWSLNDSLAYSTGRSATAVTSCQDFQLPFNENFSSLSLECWSFPEGQGNWTFGSSYTPPSSVSGAPNAFFNWSPSLTNYSHSLTSPVMDATSMANIKLDFILFINSYSSNSIENMAVEYKTLDATEWTLLELFTTAGLGGGNAEHIRTDQTLEGLSGNLFQVRFRAHGPNSFNINGWGLDDVHIHGESMPDLPGDSNCDGDLNLLDAITTVSYVMGNNPEPFCWDNADVTQDGVINVLDIIGTVNIILSGAKTSPYQINSSAVHIYLNSNSIELKSDGTLAGIQFELFGLKPENLKFQLNGFEFISTQREDKTLGLIFSFDNSPIPAGKIKLFAVENDQNTAAWGKAVAGNLNAEEVFVTKHLETNAGKTKSTAELRVFPNPSSGVILIESSEQVRIEVIDMVGRTIGVYEVRHGLHHIDLTTKGKGIYFLKVHGSEKPSIHKLVIR